MSKRLKEMLAKSAGLRAVADIQQNEVPTDQAPRTGPVRIAQLERMKFESELPLDQLYEIPGRRRALTPEQYEELKQNLQNNPLITPITARRRKEGGYEIIAGHNRVRIYKELGRERIASYVREIDDEHVERVAFYSNLLSPSLPDFEKYLGLKARMEEDRLTQVQVGAESGLTQASISRLLSFSGLPNEAITALSNAEDKTVLGATAAAKLVMAAKAGRSEAVIGAVQEMISGKINQKEAVRISAGKTTKPRQAATIIKLDSGVPFCSIRRAPKKIQIELKRDITEALYAELLAVAEKHSKIS